MKRGERKKDDVGEEIADVMIYLLGLSEILNIDLEKELINKINKNKHREYKIIDGVNTRIKYNTMLIFNKIRIVK